MAQATGIKEIIKPENLVYKKTKIMTDTVLHYCPGCGHSVVHRVLMEVIDELGIAEQTVGVAPVGCSVFAYNYMNVDMQEAAHGRASAVATGIKRVYPDRFVFAYQGDGESDEHPFPHRARGAAGDDGGKVF